MSSAVVIVEVEVITIAKVSNTCNQGVCVCEGLFIIQMIKVSVLESSCCC